MGRDKKFLRSEEPQPQQEEMTVVVLKFKGGSQSLQKGFDAVSQALAALGASPTNNHRAVRTQAQLASAVNTEIVDPESEIEESASNATPGEEEQELVSSAPAKQKKGPATPRYTFLSDLELAPSGQPSLKEYCATKNPQAEFDKFLVASAWLQKHGGQETFTGGHLFTAFRAMEWKTQVDMTQPLRTLKSKKSYYENPSSGQWKLTGIGLDAAEAVGKE